MTSEQSQAPRVALLTLGCPKNEVDSRTMRGLLEARGYTVTEGVEEAHFILLNTCAFIEAAVEESLDTIFELAALPHVQSGECKLVVAGCLPSRFGADLTAELPEVAAFVPVAEESSIVEVLDGLVQAGQGLVWNGGRGWNRGTGLVFQFDLGQIGTLTPSPCSNPAPRSTPSPVPPVPIPWAYVKISDGCSRHCSYCTIPSIRGPYHSYSFEAIINEVESLVAQGAREIILVGQDTGIWSAPEKPQNLAELLNSLASAYPQTWFRVMYLQPEGITDELLAVMAQHANIARYLDIPLQHASAEILASMNRKGSGKEYLELVSRIREALPGVVLRTTVMVGYPGESPEDYNELCAFIEAACFDYVGIFVYSPEEGTAAAALSRQIDEETAKERLQELRDKADLIGFERADRQLGQRTEVLICGQDEEGVYGRTKGQAPDVDGITYLYVPNDAGALTLLPDKTPPGTVVQVTISETVLYDLFAEITTETQ